MTVRLKIAKASFILITASIIGHALSLFKEALLANYFGISKTIDALYSASAIPDFIIDVVFAAFSVVFIPFYIKQRTDNKENADQLASVIVNNLFSVLVIVSGAVYVLAPWLVSVSFKGLDPATALLTANILKILSITILLTGFIRMATGILNSLEHFSGPAFSQMFITLGIVIFMVLFSKRLGVYAIVFGTMLGLSVQALTLAYITKGKGFGYSLVFKSDNPALREIVGYLPLLLILFLCSQSGVIINRVMASSLPSGSIAALSYAYKLVSVPLTIFLGSITVAILPFFSQQYAKRELDSLKETFSLSMRMSGFIFIPITVVMVLFARPLVQILFERGVFDAQATKLTSQVLVCYSFQLLFAFAAAIMIRMLFALQDYSSLLKISIMNVLMIVCFNFAFIKIINPPAAGIALANSVVSLFSSVLYFAYLKKKLVFMNALYILKSLSLSCALSIPSGLIMLFVFNGFGSLLSISLAGRVLTLLVSSVLGMIFYLGAAYLLKLEEFFKVYNLVKYKLTQVNA